MNDDEFLGYVHLHSETPRALFSGEHIRRLCKLAGRPEPSMVEDSGFYALHSNVAHPLVNRARMRQKLVVLPGGKR